MQWLKSIIEKHTEWSRLNKLIETIESSEDTNPELCVDCSKAVMESVCKTILADRGITVDDTITVPRLTKDTFKELMTEHLTDDTNKGSLAKVNGGFGQMMTGVAELRNNNGFASHGQDLRNQRLPSLIAKLVARMTDSLCGFYIQVHKNFMDIGKRQRLYYEDHKEFNEYWNELFENVKMGEYSYTPSETLFNNDPEAYKQELLTWKEAPKEEEL